MPKCDDLSRSLVALDQDSTLIAVIEMSQKQWLVGALVPGLAREPQKKLAPEAPALVAQIERWRAEAAKAGRVITRVCVAYEAGRDGFWLARWLCARGIECYVIHPTSIPVSREHRRAKSDRLDVGLLQRSFLGWLRGEKKHCSMVAVPSREEEDGKRPLRERDRWLPTPRGWSTASRACWRCTALPGSMCARKPRRRVCGCCAPPRASCCRSTPWPNWCGRSSGCSRSRRRSPRSRRRSDSG
jgi:hypothetical protein